MIPRRRHSEDIGFQIAPMIDITWILIIFFMVTTHLVDEQFSVDVQLPLASAGEIPKDESGREIVSIDAVGKYFIGSQELSLPQLTAHLKQRMIDVPPLKVYVRADALTPGRQIKDLMRACADATAVEVIFATFKEEQ